MDGCSSNGSGENTWLDLSKSDYAKVIFEGLYWDSDSNEVGCYFNVTESVNKSPSDYLGLFKVGYDDISQCLASKKLCQLVSEEQSKSMYCKFMLNELPDLDGYYQFVYITQDKEVCGASMPIFLLHKSKVDVLDEELTTEKVEDGFLMVRHGLEKKCCMLETEMSMMSANCEKLERENDILRSKIENEQIANNNIVKELKAIHQETTNALLRDQQDMERKLEELQNENCNLKDTIVAIKIKKDVALSKVQNLQKENDSIAFKLEVAEKERDECLIKLDNLKWAHNALDANFQKCKVNQTERADRSHREDLMNDFCGLSNGTITDSKYKKILESDPAFSDILEALQERKHLIEQLEDALCMVKASEDSKCLAMAEMSNLSETLNKQKEDILNKNLLLEKKDEELKKQRKDIQRKNALLEKKDEELKKAMDDFHRMKCKNVALRIYLDEEDKRKKSDEMLLMEKSLQDLKASLDSETAFKKELIEKLKRFNPNVKEESLNEDVENLLSKAESIATELETKSKEILLMEKSLVELKASLDIETAFKKDLIEKIKTFNPNVKEEFLDKDMENLLSKAESMEILLKEISEESEKKDFIIQQLRNDLNAATERVSAANAKAEATIEEIEKLKSEMEKLSIKGESKDITIEQLHKEMKVLEEKKAAAELDAKEKTVRLLEASKLYRKQYIQIERLQKKKGSHSCSSEHAATKRVVVADAKAEQTERLKSEIEKLKKELERKVIFIEQQNKEKVSSNSFQNAARCKSAQSNSVTYDVKKSANNSDSDTGEHVRSLNSRPEKKVFSEKLREFMLNRGIEESKVKETKQSSAACCSKSQEIREELNTPSSERKMNSMNLQDLYKAESLEETFDIPCCCCEKSFNISAKSSLPLFEHYESEHKMQICPICGELFDNVIPWKYFLLHVNDHFNSK